MSSLKTPIIGRYGPKTRALQRRLSFERTSLTWKTANVYKYLGSRRNSSPALTDIDPIFMGVADRAYDVTPIEINIGAERLNESPMDLSRFGIINPLGESQVFRIHINSFASDGLGRYIVNGDILEIPFFLEDGRSAYFEVEDVDRKPEFENFYVTVTTKPIKDQQETAEIPDIPTNSDLLLSIEEANEALAASDVAYENVNSNYTGYADFGYFADDYTLDPQTFADEEDRTDYEVRREEQQTFLDDPNAEIF